jgi:hypothetical protein
LTPLRLIHEGHLLKQAQPKVFFHRLLERCQRLAFYYTDSSQRYDASAWQATTQQLLHAAEGLQVAYNASDWAEARSGSRRQGRYTPISGLTGRIRWEGDLTLLLPWLYWGQSLHVGKNAVKGNGWYKILH